MNLEFYTAEDLLELEIVNNDPWALGQREGVTILSDKELLAGYIDADEGMVVGAVFNSISQTEDEDGNDYSAYSFDTVVDHRYQGQGLGTNLIAYAMDEFNQAQDCYPDLKLELDVINPGIISFLERTYGVKVIREERGHYIMGVSKAKRITASKVREELRIAQISYLDTVPSLLWRSLSEDEWETLNIEGLSEEHNLFDKDDWVIAELPISKEDKEGLMNFEDWALEKFNMFDIQLKDKYDVKLIDLIDYDQGTLHIVKPTAYDG